MVRQFSTIIQKEGPLMSQLQETLNVCNEEFKTNHLPVRVVSRNQQTIEFVITNAMIKPLLKIRNITDPNPVALKTLLRQNATKIISNTVKHFTSLTQFARNDATRQLYLNTLNKTIDVLVPWLLQK